MANMSTGDAQRSYAIQCGSAFVNEYGRYDMFGQRSDGGPDDHNHLLAAYPLLWPYGMGGVETHRDIEVPYNVHVQWLLQYSDRRFRLHSQFIFQAFGVLQK